MEIIKNAWFEFCAKTLPQTLYVLNENKKTKRNNNKENF